MNTNDIQQATGFDYLFIPLYGQSLATSTNGVADPVSTLYCRQFSSGINVAPNNNSTLVPLEKLNDTITMCLNTIIQERDVDDETVLVTSMMGIPGRTIEQLSQGTTIYDNFLLGVTQLKRIADEEGKTMNFPAICWMQGEANILQDIDQSTYENKLTNFLTNLDLDVKAITGQSNAVKLMTYQVATHGDMGRYPRIAMEQLNASINNPNIYLSKVMYVADYKPEPDEIHGEPQTYGLTGAKFGFQIYNEILSNAVKPVFSVKNHAYSNLKSVIIFNVPSKPLVFETTEVTPLSDGNFGFKLFDVFESSTDVSLNTISEPTAIITSIQITGVDTIEITYDSDPTGSRLTYGVFGLGWEQVTGTQNLADTGRVNGARGNLRDSQGESVSIPIRDVALTEVFNKLHNYCPIFEIQL